MFKSGVNPTLPLGRGLGRGLFQKALRIVDERSAAQLKATANHFAINGCGSSSADPFKRDQTRAHNFMTHELRIQRCEKAKQYNQPWKA
jgi:hypothetical protein